MANTIEYHAKLMMGDLLLQIAALRSENEGLREENGTLRAQIAQADPPKDEQ